MAILSFKKYYLEYFPRATKYVGKTTVFADTPAKIRRSRPRWQSPPPILLNMQLF
jgi:hypothetical protein